MKNRSLIFISCLLIVAAIVLRRFGYGIASVILNISVLSLAISILFSRTVFRTILARLVLVSSLFGSLTILQYWLDSKFIIVPVASAFFIFMMLSFKYVQDKPAGTLVFSIIFFVYLLSLVLNPRQFHNLFRATGYEDYVLLKYRQDQGLMADLLINNYKVIDIVKANEKLADAFREDSLKNFEAALKLYNSSIENNPDNPIAYHRRGFLKLTRLELNPSNVVSALKDFSRAIRLNPKFAEAYFQRSMAFHFIGYKERAYLDQLKVLQLESNLTDTEFEKKYGRSKKSLTIPPNS